MPDETTIGFAETPDDGGLHGGGGGEQSPLQARAEFFQNGSWDLVVSLNRGTCARGGAQHGANPETHEAVAADWRRQEGVACALGEAFDFLRACHRRAPFLFFNGNTFADFGRRVAAAVFAELPSGRLRQVTSAVAHYIAGVLDREAMVEIIESLCRAADLVVGTRVMTLGGSLRGVIVRVLEDGRVVVRPDGSAGEIVALPENLLPEAG